MCSLFELDNSQWKYDTFGERVLNFGLAVQNLYDNMCNWHGHDDLNRVITK